MNTEIKNEWVRRLRSGLYIQGKGRLKRAGRYCCLGVLCGIAIDHGIIPPGGTAGDLTTYGAGNDTSMLPGEVVAWAELSQLGVLPTRTHGELCLADLNDVGFSFKQISDVIEELL